METFLLSALIVCLAVLGMAVGALLGRRPLSAGCVDKGRSLGAGIGCGACGVEGDDGKPEADPSPGP